MMIRPANFGYNPETAVSNAFQKETAGKDNNIVAEMAKKEFDLFVNKLRSKGVIVMVVEDTVDPVKPDAVFPNNWISFHQDGSVILYPMQAPTRRLERRPELVNEIGQSFHIKKRFDLGNFEAEEKFLEGTGSMVLDRINKIVYACLSPRTDEELIDIYCDWMSYEKVVFHSADENEMNIYHTNVMMAMGERFVVICLDSIRDKNEREVIIDKFKETDKTIIEITYNQMNCFAGNMLQVKSSEGKLILVMSEQAYNSLSALQISQLESFSEILYSPINTIETHGGGSTRCMMAEVFLEKKD